MTLNDQEYLDRLHSLQVSATAISDPAEFFLQSHPLLESLVSSDYSIIFFHDKMNECLIAPFIYNILPSPTQEKIVITYQNPLIKDLLISRQLVSRKPPDILLSEENVLYELFIPIVTPEEVLGCLYLARTKPQPFTTTEIRLAVMCAFSMVAPLERIHWEVRAQQTHEILNEFREKYLSILDAIPYPAIIVNTETDLLQEVNRAFLEWLGYGRQEIFSKKFSSLCRFKETIAQKGDTWPPRPFEVRVKMANQELHDTTAFSAWLTTKIPEKRLIFFIVDWLAPIRPILHSQMEQIIYTVSHDLKAPIQSLKGFATLLREEFAPTMPKDALSYLERIFANLEQMEKFVADLLNYSRLQSDDNNFTENESRHILKLALDSLAGVMEQQQMNLTIAASLPRITCDPTQMTQVFTNLISNALKFTHNVDMPTIEIGCSSLVGEYEFYVKDNGRGIQPHDLPHIFDLFFSRDEDHKNKSSGVGLAIVKRIIERHHGKVWAESLPTNGTVIKFTLPKVLHPQLILV